MKGSKTKIAGYLLIAVAVLNIIIDLLNGNGFAAQEHYNSIFAALTGVGFIGARNAISKNGKNI